MAKLHFNYSVMNAGKSLQLLSVRHNYIEHGGKVILFTSALDDRSGIGRIASRLGVEAEAHALRPSENVFDLVAAENVGEGVTAVLVDEVQFLTPEQVTQLSDVVDYLDVPVLCYGLKNNSQGDLFSPAIAKLLALSNDINEIKQVCHCNSKATMILRYDLDGTVVRGGEVVETGGESRYVSVCRRHWKSGNIGPKAKRAVFEAGHGLRVTCRTCLKDHQAIDDDAEQGINCAAQLKGRSVWGYYGSSVADGREFLFEGGIPDDAKQGVICDDCIRRFVGEGSLRPVEHGSGTSGEDAFAEG